MVGFEIEKTILSLSSINSIRIKPLRVFERNVSRAFAIEMWILNFITRCGYVLHMRHRTVQVWLISIVRMFMIMMHERFRLHDNFLNVTRCISVLT